MVEPRSTRAPRSAAAAGSPRARHRAADGESSESREPRESREDARSSKASEKPNSKSDAKASPRKPTLDARRAAALAAGHVRELTGKAPEGVTGLERLDDGWRVGIEVLESRRIPDSIDLLAVYSVELDGHGELVGYRREQRYHRGRPEEPS